MAKDRVTQYQYVVRLPGDLREALHEQAEAEDRPIARIIRSALRRYIESERRVTPA